MAGRSEREARLRRLPAVPLRGGDRHLMNVPQLMPRAAASAAGALAGLSAWAARSLTGFETQTL